MNPESNAPVLVGAGVVQQRIDDVDLAADAAALMAAAITNAARDAGSRFLVPAAEVLLTPRGTWAYNDPAPLVLARHAAMRSIVADIGVLQQTLISRACDMVAGGEAEIVIVCGGEAKYRALQGQITGAPVTERTSDGEPSERMVPAGEIITAAEIARGLPVPARQYAMIDTALRRHQGLSRAAHLDLLATLWSDFSDVAAANPDAWLRRRFAPAELRDPSPSNPLLAWPYNKLHCSQWNVDQAVALIICSAAAATRYEVPRDRWVFAHAGVQSNLMVPLTRRADMHRSPAVAAAGAALQEHGISAADIEHVDLYSCFPAAVRIQQAELDITAEPLTVTGGMAFGGGPLNSYSLHALATMAQVLRGDPSGRGLVTNVSGMLTKYGLSVWSCTPPNTPYASIDVTEQARATTATIDVAADYQGPATTVTYTVAGDKGGLQLGIVVGETPDGARCLATTADPAVLTDMVATDWCDRSIVVDGADLLS